MTPDDIARKVAEVLPCPLKQGGKSLAITIDAETGYQTISDGTMRCIIEAAHIAARPAVEALVREAYEAGRVDMNNEHRALFPFLKAWDGEEEP